ncbi:alcohol dehydrogenase catalytic domain-containing protein [Candidatus Woesearchaeota archaeon]|nr:alcohol dehydrogenase catalytic domain-containing protein [Candidatus Woesearchaeota archaeon]
MKVAVYYNNNDLRLEERPKPKIGKGEILVKVKASGICGTDVMEWYRIKKAPRVLGHEISGEIVEVSSDVKNFKVGQRVFVSHHVPCNNCKYCLEGNHTACETLHTGNFDPGGFSQFVRVPKINVENGTYVLPDNVSYEEGSMVEPLACVTRAQKMIDVKPNHKVLILGSGVSGLLNIQVAKLRGAYVIATDINDYRLNKAKEFGADKVIDAKKHDLDIKADMVIVCTGALQAAGQAFNCIDKKGTILFFAIPNKNIEVPSLDFWRNEITITSSYGAAPNDLEESLKLIQAKKMNIKGLITHKLDLGDIGKGFKLVAEPKDSLKVIINPDRIE